MTVVKTNLYRVFISLITIGLISVQSLISQCNLMVDTLVVPLPLGSCELTNSELVDLLKMGDCPDAFSVFPAGPFVINTTTQIEIFDNSNVSKATIHIQINPYLLVDHPIDPMFVAQIQASGDFIEYELLAGECTANKDLLLDAFGAESDNIIRSDIRFMDGQLEIETFSIGDTVYIDQVLCNGQQYWPATKLLFKPEVATHNGPLIFNKSLTTCPTTIEDVLAGIGYLTNDCDVDRFEISNQGPFGFGSHFLGYIKLDDYYLVQNALIQVNGICNFDTLDFGVIETAKCYLNEDDIIEALGFKDEICDLSIIDIVPPGPYEDSSFAFSVFVGGQLVCSDLQAVFQRDTTFNELTSLFCNNNLNISLDKECSVTLTAETLLEGGPYCILNYIISALDENGQLVAEGHTITINTPGTYTISIRNPRTGNSCWSTVVIEDKFIFDVRCEPDTILCYDNNETRPDTVPGFGPDFPYVGEPAIFEETDLPNFYLVHTDNECGIYYAFYVDEPLEECIDEYKEVFERHWAFEDHAGNLDTCIQKIYVEKPDLGSIDVDPFNANCLSDFIYFDEAGHPDPHETGYPEIIGTDHKADICGTIKMTYNDTRFPLCGKSVKIIREWILIDWCNNRVEDYDQVIEIKDTIPPIFTSELYDIFLETDPFICGVEDLQLDAPQYEDCGTDKADLEIFYENYNYYGEKSWYSNGPSLVIPELYMHGPTGEFQIVYVLTDDCGNSASDTITVFIEDKEPPIAICDEHTVISVNGSGLAQVRALTFDDISVDNCGIAGYYVRKVNGRCFVEEEFTDVIRFCCEEVGDSILVEFKVVDYAGNYNTCMVMVEIQDKFPPIIYCPDDVTIDCQDDYTDLNLTGEAWAIDNCDYTEIVYVDEIDLNDCGEGTILRHWSATDVGGFERTCTQIITVSESEPFNMTIDRFPGDVFLVGCGLDLSPESTGEPDISNFACANVAFSHQDAYFNTVDGACFKIVREWTVIDWCRYGENGPDEGIWRHSQIIKQENDVAPLFLNIEGDTTICLTGQDCIEEITIEIEAMDDCSSPSDLLWFVELYAAEDPYLPLLTSTSPVFTEFLETGEYYAEVRVADGCGNVSFQSLTISVVDCEPPVLECPPFASSVVLGENGQVALWVSDFNLKGSDNCTVEEKLIYSFSPDSILNFVAFSCEDIPNGVALDSFIRFYVFDEEGNSGFCEMALEIKDNSLNLCEDRDSIFVTGLILTEEYGNVDDVHVNLATGASSNTNLITGLSGTYAFKDITEGADYVISLDKEGRIDDGVTTFDLVLIAQHAVGLRNLGSPYKVIAADIDNNYNVSAIDLAWLRRVILGRVDQFPNGQKNWRFVDEGHVFTNPDRPFPFPEQISISDIRESQVARNFVAVKIGDVNGTNEVSSRVQGGGRSYNEVNFLVEDAQVEPGKTQSLPVTLNEDMTLSGLQFAWKTNPAVKILGVEEGVLDLGESHFVFSEEENELRVSWNAWNRGIEVQPDQVLFHVVVESKISGSLGELISVDHRDEFHSEVINTHLESKNLNFEFVPASIEDQVAGLLTVFDNRPNPFRDYTIVPFSLNVEMDVHFNFYDVDGRQIYSYSALYDKGQNELKIKAEDLHNHSGIVLYTVSAGQTRISGKLSIIK